MQRPSHKELHNKIRFGQKGRSIRIGPLIGGKMKDLNCPKGHGPMALKELEKQTTFKGLDITYLADIFVCPECGIEAGTVKTAGNVQRAIADAYRSKTGLLTSQ